MKLIGIVGTNAAQSYNRQLLQYMQRQFKSVASIELLEIQDLPLFKENEQPVPAGIQAASRKIAESDGIIIATPEYNHSIPSALKSLLDWLSCTSHPFAKHPIMIVGASYGSQGTSRAQLHLRQILDAPGVEGIVMPGDEFLLSDCKNAFDAQGNLKDQKTVQFLTHCVDDFKRFATDVLADQQQTSQECDTKMKQINWDATYDTIVLGFGGAGATAARFAADAGATVLLADAAPNGHEGGNTRYSAQLIGTVDDFDEGKKYYQNLTHPMDLDDDMVDTFVDGMANMRDYVQRYLNVKPVSVKNDFTTEDSPISLDSAVHEYPEFGGQQAYDFTTVQHGIFDAALWRNLRQQVLKRSDKIDVWLSAPAKHLIQDPETKTIIGVQIERNHILLNIRALNGVVLAVGGFENNRQAVQDYLGADHLAPLGTLYNKGDGIRMAQEVGADLWHMANYEALGMLHGMAPAVKPGERGQLIVAWPDASNGSVITVADDGSRYFKEDEPNRHGHIYDHGTWRVPRTNVHPTLIFDQAQYDQMKQSPVQPLPDFEERLISAPTLAALAKIIHAEPAILEQTVTDFNHFAETGKDYAFDRAPESMRAFSDGPYYALALTHDVLNTQGGPRRNSRSEILDANQNPIPHLYGAGELGGICANQYQGGGNLAECLIFGKIAGENAARAKSDYDFGDIETTEPETPATTDATTAASEHETAASSQSDLAADDFSDIELGDNQYLGVSDTGMGGAVAVRITDVDGQLTNVEIVSQSETGEIGGRAVATLPQQMVDANSYDVDVVSGASVTSRAIKDAVKAALAKVPVAGK